MSQYIPRVGPGSKSYKTEENAIKRANDICAALKTDFKFLIMKADNGRFVPVFYGSDAFKFSLWHEAHVIG